MYNNVIKYCTNIIYYTLYYLLQKYYKSIQLSKCNLKWMVENSGRNKRTVKFSICKLHK